MPLSATCSVYPQRRVWRPRVGVTQQGPRLHRVAVTVWRPSARWARSGKVAAQQVTSPMPVPERDRGAQLLAAPHPVDSHERGIEPATVQSSALEPDHTPKGHDAAGQNCSCYCGRTVLKKNDGAKQHSGELHTGDHC
jgi:hypothetical protein